MTENEKYLDYLQMLRRPFQKLCRLRFLQPDGSTAFMLDNDPYNMRAGAFIAGNSSISHSWQNGRRTSASVTLDNVDGAYDYNFNTVWFGQEIALDEGLILSDGVTEFYIQQGVFLIESPAESVQPTGRTVQYNLVDKVAALDGSLGGNLEGTYQVAVGTNIFTPIASLLAEDKGNGYPIDRVTPIFTNYYNSKTQALPDGSTVSMVLSPYTLTVDAGQTKWAVISGLAEMVNGWIGYDETGALRLDPSQDDILDADKPVAWAFSMAETQLLGMAYTVKNTDVYNDYIVVGDQLDDNSQPRGRAQILDPASPVDINAIGRKTIRVQKSGFGTDTQCRDYAEWMVKRSSVLQRAVNISCSQIMHIRGNEIVTLTRTDKAGNPTERHLVQGFTRPLAGNGAMQINATSVNDFPVVFVNLLDVDEVGIEQGAISSSTGANSSSSSRIRTAGYVACNPSTKYIVTGKITGSATDVYILEYTAATGDFTTTYSGTSSGWQASGYSFTTQSTTQAIRVVFRKNGGGNVSPTDLIQATMQYA